jgi:hypothetical protein
METQMKTIFFSFAAMAALSFPFASPGLAGPHDSKTSSTSHSSKGVFANHTVVKNISHDNGNKYANYHLTNGTKFAHGYFYRGREHSHWSSHRFDSRYGCECYFDPCCSCWYYWCQPDGCYYPVTHCPYRVYTWSPVVAVQSVPCATCTSVTVPVSVQTVTRTTFVTTTVRTQPVVTVVGSVGVQEGAPVPNSLPPIPAPVARQ